MQKLLQNPIILILLILAIALLGGGTYYSIQKGQGAYSVYTSNIDTQKNLKELEEKLNMLQEEKRNRPIVEKKTDKIIYETTEMGVGSEASFAPLFDIFLTLAKASGLRIRSIAYNYSPSTDPIVSAGLSNYNVCELDIKAVGSYRNFQTFFRAVAKEPYLMSLSNTDVKPWENDRTLLIGNLKLNLYTKTH